jgi:hypothetical protein
MENWKTFHTTTKGNYEISNLGRIRNTITNNILKLSNNSSGYKTYKINKQWFFVSRLTANAFITNPNNLPNVCHKDNDKSNNSVDNLYWGTQSDNIKQCVKDGRHPGFSNLKRQNQYTKAKLLGLPKPKGRNQYSI